MKRTRFATRTVSPVGKRQRRSARTAAADQDRSRRQEWSGQTRSHPGPARPSHRLRPMLDAPLRKKTRGNDLNRTVISKWKAKKEEGRGRGWKKGLWGSIIYNLYTISSVESQKGIITTRGCSNTSQKGAIATQILWWLHHSGSQRNLLEQL